MIKGVHVPIISERVFYKNQAILSGTIKNYSKQAELDWPLRGGFLKYTCGKQMTGSAPRGKSGPSPRYSCMECRKGVLGVVLVSKMRTPLHDDFMELLRHVQPSEGIQKLFKKITLRQWNTDFKDVLAVRKKLNEEINELNKRKFRIVDLFIEDQLTLKEKNQKLDEVEGELAKVKLKQVETEEYVTNKEEIIDGALMFISNPSSFWNISLELS